MIRSAWSLYGWNYPRAIVYMLQSSEYHIKPYLHWYWHTSNFSRIEYRRSLDTTSAAKALTMVLRVGLTLQFLSGVFLIGLWARHSYPAGLPFGLALIMAAPVVWAHLIVLPLLAGRWFITTPAHRRAIRRSEQIFRTHKGAIIAIAGSYGKTSMKELLLTVLGGGKKVAATPANKNVAISHAHFAQQLNGDEEVTLIEYGEGRPGDVARFAAVTHPTHAIITGLAPAHLDMYKTTHAAGLDIFSLTRFVPEDRIFVNDESSLTKEFLRPKFQLYNQHGALGWKVHDITVDITGTTFAMSHGKRTLQLHSGLLGRHNVGPLVLAAALADSLGMNAEAIQAGISAVQPYEHRMQPYNLHGAWIIDDTYNGNLEGIRAGTALLAELTATRKIYVTPGLVDQGREAQAVHEEMGTLIADAKPDIVVLMQNSATAAIQSGLQHAQYIGDILVEDDPLSFYQNLQVFVAAGDVVLLQNDWTDNYA